MEPEQIDDIIFSVDKNIRYVGIIGPSPSHEVKLSHMREGVNSLTPEHGDREFIRTIPETILGMCKSQERDLGKVRYSLLCFHRLTLTFFRTQEYVIVMSLEAGTYARPIFDRITHLLSLDR
jgi:hypothetical protein